MIGTSCRNMNIPGLKRQNNNISHNINNYNIQCLHIYTTYLKHIRFYIALYAYPRTQNVPSQLLCWEWITDQRHEPGTCGVYTSAGYLLSKQQLLVNLNLCGLHFGMSNTAENTVYAYPIRDDTTCLMARQEQKHAGNVTDLCNVSFERTFWGLHILNFFMPVYFPTHFHHSNVSKYNLD